VVDVIVDNEIWYKIRPNKLISDDNESGLLCPECILDELKQSVIAEEFSRIEMKLV